VLPRNFQRGQAIILIALMVGVVVGMAALAIDGSRAYALRRDMQNAVDYAALAAADNYQQSGSYAGAESAAVTAFGVQMRLYAAPSCTPYGAPGPSAVVVTCTYSDGTTLEITVPVKGAVGPRFQLTATQTLSLQFGRILTNGTFPQISSSADSRVNNLLYSPTVEALDQAGCGGAGGTAISVSGSGQLQVLGDMVSNGTITVTSGAAQVGGDVWSRCQSSIAGVTLGCYPSGAVQPCTYPDVAGAVRNGTHATDPGYPAPRPVGSSQAVPGTNVNLAPGVYASSVNISGSRCYFLAGGVYQFQAGFTNAGDLVSNELKPPDEPSPSSNTVGATQEFWNTTGAHCAGSVQGTAVRCNGTGDCGTGNCGQGVGQGNGCTAAPPGTWAVEVTSTRTDTLNGISYQRESAPSTCQTVVVGMHQAIQLIVSNVPGATGYNLYAALPGSGCAGPFGLAETLAVSGSVLNNSLAACPQFSGATCSLGWETVVLNGNDLGSPFAPNPGAAPGVVGSYPPGSETAPLAAGLPNQNAPRLAGAAGDRANENSCETQGGAYASCPAAVTPGAVAFYLPGASCLLNSNTGDTYVFSGYQYDWIAVYEPPASGCANTLGASVNSAFVGLVYTPGASITNTSSSTFEVAATGGIIADTVSFTGALPAITFNAGYAPFPFAARLVS
jgi:hypothetical protein